MNKKQSLSKKNRDICLLSFDLEGMRSLFYDMNEMFMRYGIRNESKRIMILHLYLTMIEGNLIRRANNQINTIQKNKDIDEAHIYD